MPRKTISTPCWSLLRNKEWGELVKQQLPFDGQRHKMVKEQLIARGIHDVRLLEAMHNMPRHRFVQPGDEAQAYEDGPLPIGEKQTISQPYVVALMVESLDLQGGEKVLEIGTGSGYQAAVLAQLAEQVHTLEMSEKLANNAESILKELGLSNVYVHHMDGSAGLADQAPFDGIVVAAAAPKAPPPLLEQLSEGGILVIPVGNVSGQRLQRWQRKGKNFDHEEQLPVSFVPLRGEFGWQKKGWAR